MDTENVQEEMAVTNIDIMQWASLAVVTAFMSPALASAEFVVTTDGLSVEQQNAVRVAADHWTACFEMPDEIRLRVTAVDRGPTGFAYTNMVRNLDGLPLRDVWYPTALAQQILGYRLLNEDDINVFINKDTNWYLPSKLPIRADQIDLINVMLHEIAHGLGISSATFLSWQPPNEASIGLPNDYVNFFDYSFTLHEQDGTPHVYDSFIRTADGQPLTAFENPSLMLADELNREGVSFSGEQSRSVNGGVPVLVAPGNVSHVKPVEQDRRLMQPSSGAGETIHNIDPIVLAMMQDIGWVINDKCL